MRGVNHALCWSCCWSSCQAGSLPVKSRRRQKNARKGFLLVAVSVDLTVLFIFKYLGFFTENLNRLPFVRLPVPQITLPIGISFFTFQAISYVVDVYRGEAAQKSLWDVMLYIAFFPQLIAGPIVRYSDFADQIHNRQESLQKLE